ncbi:MAG: hypothetical protein U9Q68_02300 [Euryarchaeota archaeon]|nr:hypothetical protein [Euryarchaeota archaeon]
MRELGRIINALKKDKEIKSIIKDTTLIQSFFMLGGSVTETTSERVITLNRNPKEPDMMGKLALGLDVLNSFNIMTIDEKNIHSS